MEFNEQKGGLEAKEEERGSGEKLGKLLVFFLRYSTKLSGVTIKSALVVLARI